MFKKFIGVLKYTFMPFSCGCIISDLYKVYKGVAISSSNAIVDIVFLALILIINFVDVVIEDKN